MSDTQKAWIEAGLNPDNYSAACADAMRIYAKPFIELLNEYSKKINELELKRKKLLSR